MALQAEVVSSHPDETEFPQGDENNISMSPHLDDEQEPRVSMEVLGMKGL